MRCVKNSACVTMVLPSKALERNQTMSHVTDCESTASHRAHMEMNGECPLCGAYDPDQGNFGWIDDNGTIYSSSGEIIEEHFG